MMEDIGLCLALRHTPQSQAGLRPDHGLYDGHGIAHLSSDDFGEHVDLIMP
jgi:hypothetical protein